MTDGHRYKAQIDADVRVGQSLGFGDRAPWFIIGNEVVMGAPSTKNLEWAISRKQR